MKKRKSLARRLKDAPGLADTILEAHGEATEDVHGEGNELENQITVELVKLLCPTARVEFFPAAKERLDLVNAARTAIPPRENTPEELQRITELEEEILDEAERRATEELDRRRDA